MLKKTITYEDYNGETRTEDFYFNLSKAELAEMELSHSGGFQAWINALIKSQDQAAILDAFKKIVLGAYGEKDPSGRRFIKSKELSEAFEQSPAYSELFFELISSEEAASAFVNGIVPKLPANQDKPTLPVG